MGCIRREAKLDSVDALCPASQLWARISPPAGELPHIDTKVCSRLLIVVETENLDAHQRDETGGVLCSNLCMWALNYLHSQE